LFAVACLVASLYGGLKTPNDPVAFMENHKINKINKQEQFLKKHRAPFCSIELNSEPHKMTSVSELNMDISS
jgi:hypothetical protein